MNPESPVTLFKITYRGVMSFHLKWEEGGAEKEEGFSTEAEAVTAMAVIEERLRIAALAGQGLTVNPFGMHLPFINSKDVHYAALKLQPRGLKFREVIDDHVAAVTTLKGTDMGVAAAATAYAEAMHTLKAYEVSVQQAVFEWIELKKQAGDRPVYEVLRGYLQSKAAAGSPVSPAETAGGE